MAKDFWDWLELISSIIFVGFLITMLWYSMFFFKNNYPNLRDISSQMYYIGVGVAVITTAVQWIEGRIKVIIRSWDRIKIKGGVKNGWKEGSHDVRTVSGSSTDKRDYYAKD